MAEDLLPRLPHRQFGANHVRDGRFPKPCEDSSGGTARCPPRSKQWAISRLYSGHGSRQSCFEDGRPRARSDPAGGQRLVALGKVGIGVVELVEEAAHREDNESQGRLEAADPSATPSMAWQSTRLAQVATLKESRENDRRGRWKRAERRPTRLGVMVVAAT
jgi:hypothetical protein